VKKIAIAAVAVSFAAFAAQAQTLADVKKRGVLRLGYSETSVPFAFKNNEGQPSGYSVELCQRVATAIATRAGTAMKVEWVPLTPSTFAWPPSRPSVPTSRATRVTSAAKAFS